MYFYLRAFPYLLRHGASPAVGFSRCIPPGGRSKYVFFFWVRLPVGAASQRIAHCAPAKHQRKERKASTSTARRRRGCPNEHVAVATSREVRRPTSTKPPIPLAHALERGILHGERGVARRRQRARVALRLRGVGHPHVTTQESHGHGRIAHGVVGHIWGSNSS